LSKKTSMKGDKNDVVTAKKALVQNPLYLNIEVVI